MEQLNQEQTPACVQNNPPNMTAEEQLLLEKYGHALVGSFTHSCDSKGRLVIPLTFREELGNRFVLCPSLDFKAICIHTPLSWAKLREQYGQLGKISGRFMKFLNQFDALSYRNQECDAQGRLLLPGKIRQVILGDEKEVEVTGAFDHVRIVSAKVSNEMTNNLVNAGEEFANLFDELSLRMLGGS